MKAISTWLEQELEKMGFWNDENDCWKYSNDEDVTFETALENLLNDYEDEAINYDITSEQVFDSPGLDIYCYAVSVATPFGATFARSQALLFTVYVC